MKDRSIAPFRTLMVKKSEIIELTFNSIETGRELLLTYFNQNCFNVWYENENYREILQEKFKYYIDGFGVWLALKVFNNTKIVRFNASEFNDELFREFEQKQLALILIGGKFSQSILDRKPLNIELYIDGYADLQNYDEMISKIINCSSKVLIIGLGVPLQEELADKISRRIPGLQILCVGNYLEFYFGTIKRAPKILRNSGFEWTFRLFTEPKRLWRRYLIGIPKFFILVFGELLKKESNNKGRF